MRARSEFTDFRNESIKKYLNKPDYIMGSFFKKNKKKNYNMLSKKKMNR